MTKQEILTLIRDTGIVPIVRVQKASDALKIAEAIQHGGLKVVEVTMTVPGAIGVLEKIADQFGDRMVLGAGTVLDPETARSCMLAGAHFFVTPSLNLATIAMALRYSRPIMPGALTPTEIVTAWEAGADMVKVFPCEAMGGAKYIKAVKAPLPQIELVPTGGVDIDNCVDFLKAGASAVAVGSQLVDSKLVAQGEFQKIEALAQQFVQKIREARSQSHSLSLKPMQGGAMPIAQELLDILVCPKCRYPVELLPEENGLKCTNPECRLVYPIRDDIPVMLIDEARVAS